MTTKRSIEENMVDLLNDYLYISEGDDTPYSYHEEQQRIHRISEYAKEKYDISFDDTKLIFQSIMAVARKYKNISKTN